MIKNNNIHLKKNFRPNSPAFFFMEFHDLTIRASCSSPNALTSNLTQLHPFQIFVYSQIIQ